MKKLCVILLSLICAAGLSACGSTNDPDSTQYTTVSSVESGTEPEEMQQSENNFTEQDIISMFNKKVADSDTEYLDCVLIPDKAAGRVGAVLFRNNENNTVNVAFFDEDGDAQRCGTYAQSADAPDMTYLGNGKVTCKMKTEDGTVYNYVLTISSDDGNIAFIAEDDLPK